MIMKKMTDILVWGGLMLLASCRQAQIVYTPEEEAQLDALHARMEDLEEARPEPPQGYTVNTYPNFITSHGYPRCMTIFHDAPLMEQATLENSHIVISLFHQRGRLYVNGQVAADWPVSTGVEGRATALGEYKVLEKKKDHASGRFGQITDAAGNVLVADADSRKHTTGNGNRWVGSPMPNWMRLTDYGMGMHTGIVKPGTRLSHGCIRMPDYIASRLFDIVQIGHRVTVIDELEPEFPALEDMTGAAPHNAWLNEKRGLEKEIEKIEEAAQKRMSSTEDAAAAAAPTATTAPEPAVPAESATQG